MHILIYGTGGVGGFFGAKLAQTEHQLSCIARGAHLEAIKKHGIRVESVTGDFQATPDLVTDRLSDIDPPDVVLFCLKAWQLEKAASDILQYCNDTTLFLPLSNGAGNTETLNAVLPRERVLVGLCRMISYIKAPGIIANPSIPPSLLFGTQTNAKKTAAESLLAVFKAAGIEAAIPPDIQLEVWKKFLYITTVSALGGLTRVPIGVMRTQPYLRDLMEQTAKEVVAIAQALDIPLSEDSVAKTLQVIDQQDFDTTASTQRDIMDGKPSELENFNGYILEKGAALGIVTPANRLVYELLLPQEQKARSRAQQA